MRKKWKIIIVLSTILLSFLIFRIFLIEYYRDFLEYWTLRDKIVWSEQSRLKWNDLNYNKEKEGLYINVGLSIRFKISNPILFRSNTVLIKKTSSVSDTTDMLSLRIAQAKFDLLEIYRRKMLKEVDSLNMINSHNLKPSYFYKMNDRYYDEFDTEWKKHLAAENEIESLKKIEEKINRELFGR